MELDLKRLGKVLAERRQTLGVPKSVVARRVKVSPSYISIIERGVAREGGRLSRPSRDVVLRWGQALGWGDNYLGTLLRLAGYDESPGSARSRIPFRGQSLDYPQPRLMEQERLLEEVRDLLQKASDDPEAWERVTLLLGSYIQWLKFEQSKTQGE